MMKFQVMVLAMGLGLIGASSEAAESKESSNTSYETVRALDPNNPAFQVDKDELVRRALKTIKEEKYSLTKEQIKAIQDMEIERQKALSMRSKPKELKGIIQMSTMPHAETMVIKLAPNRFTTLTIVDNTGQPWPISSVVTGAPEFVKVAKKDNYSFGNAINLKAKLMFGYSNLAVTLEGLPITFNVDIEISEKEYHSTPILQVDGAGPNASVDSQGRELSAMTHDGILKDLLQYVPDDGFSRLKTNDNKVEGWLYEGELYVRTHYVPLSPSPVSTYYGPNGLAAYRMSDIPVVIFRTPQGAEKIISFTATN